MGKGEKRGEESTFNDGRGTGVGGPDAGTVPLALGIGVGHGECATVVQYVRLPAEEHQTGHGVHLQEMFQARGN